MMSRDPPTLEFCARHGIPTGYFRPLYPRADAAPRYRVFLEKLAARRLAEKAEHRQHFVLVAGRYQTDQKALDTALFRASRAYEGFWRLLKTRRKLRSNASPPLPRRLSGAASLAPREIMANVFNPDYLLKHDLVFIGSPDTVAAKIRAAADAVVFDTFMGEFNLFNLPEGDLMRSIRLFGEQVIPALRGYEPF